MHSRAEPSPPRLALELAARVLAMLLLLALLVASLLPRDDRTPRRVEAASLDASLRAATVGGDSSGLVVRLDQLPHSSARDWLRALRVTGVAVWWHGEVGQPVVLTADPLVDPRGGVEVRLWRTGDDPAVLRDAAGELARMQPAAGTATLIARTVVRSVEATTPRQRASAAVADSLVLRDVLVFGRAGWEARFTLRALEELGWRAHARLGVAPGVAVVQGRPSVPDTSRFAAVIVLDTSEVVRRDAAALARFARSGGGLVIAGEAAGLRAFSAVLPGRVGKRAGAVITPAATLPEVDPRSGLAFFPVQELHEDAVVLERRGAADVIAGRRIGAGRVVQAGYEESWRLRMEGGEEGPALHQEWWARLLAAVAYTPAVPRGRDQPPELEAAPFAAFIGALGPASAPGAAQPILPALPAIPLLAGAFVLLLVEWGSRRLRGAG